MSAMNLDEAIAIYLYLNDARPAVRDTNPAFREAWGVICKYADEAIDRYNSKRSVSE